MKERDFWSIPEWKDRDIDLIDNVIIKKKIIRGNEGTNTTRVYHQLYAKIFDGLGKIEI